MSQVPIAGLTAHAMKGDRERCLEAGMDGHIAKPLQPGGLFESMLRGKKKLESFNPLSAEAAEVLKENVQCLTKSI
jgi:CheY-like chemotaxis protein